MKRILYTLIITLVIVTTPTTILYAQNSTEQQPVHDHATPVGIQQKTMTPINATDIMVDHAKKQLDQIYSLLTGLSGMISNNQIPSIKNKKDTLNNIQAINQLIHKIQRERFVNTNLQTAHFLLTFNQGLLKHIIKALSSSFTHMPEFDPTILFKKTVATELSPKNVHALLMMNENRIKHLKKQSEIAGLSWYNLVYRKIDDYVLQPSRKYDIPKRTIAALAAASTAVYIWWRFGDTTFNKYCPKPIRAICGPRPMIHPATGGIANEKSLKALGKLEYNLTQLGHGFLPLGAAVSGFTIKALKNEWQKEIAPWLHKKIRIWDNKLKGGAYLREAQKIAQIVDQVSFNDLVGLDDVKETFGRLVQYLMSPESHDRINATPPKGILLVGETRTGKSFSVKALFGEISLMLAQQNRQNEFRFIEFSATDINQHGIDELLRLVKRCAPCVVFIDEIDLLDLQRKGQNKLLSDFLTCMSGTVDSNDPKNQVIIIAATNRPENLDVALRQPGRFGKEIRFEYPAFKERYEFIARQMNKLSLSTDMFNIEQLARETEGQSFEALKMLINSAVLNARVRNQMITQEHIEQTLDEEIRHVATVASAKISPYEKQIIAAHIAGQAVALLHLNMHTKLAKVTIKQVMKDIKEELMGMHLYRNNNQQEEEHTSHKRFEYGSVFTYHDFDTINMHTRDEKMKLCQYHLAGIVAEELFIRESCGYSCHKDDMPRALALMESIAFEGLDKKQLPKKECEIRAQKALDLLYENKQAVTALLSEHNEQVMLIAQALQYIDTLTIDDITMLFQAHEKMKAQELSKADTISTQDEVAEQLTTEE